MDSEKLARAFDDENRQEKILHFQILKSFH